MSNTAPKVLYFLYARKSTDEEDRQVRSIEAQLQELRDLAAKESLHVTEEFIESKTAKTPGRPIFNLMMQRIEQGEAEGILAWHPDRLARNSMDGGLIIYLLDSGKLQALKFHTFWFENTPQGKFMLNIAFGQSKYFVDNLSENVQRGIRQKLRRGEFPGRPILGYKNEPKLRTIVLDEETAPLVKKMFEAYATNRYSVPELRDLVTDWGLRTTLGNPITRSNMWNLLAHPFYIGLIRYNGELYEGSHPALVPKDLFEKVQRLLKENSRPRRKSATPFPLLRLLTCEECGCAITAEKKKGHHYYRCTKKKQKCSQPYVREESLAEQLRAIIQTVAVPESWRTPIFNQLDNLQTEQAKEENAKRQALQIELGQLDQRLENLLDAHLDSALTREEYVRKKEKYLKEKLDIKDKLGKLSSRGNFRLGPARRFYDQAIQAGKIARDENLEKIRDFFRSVGSDLTLAARRARCEWEKTWSILAGFDRNSGWLTTLDKYRTWCMSENAVRLTSLLEFAS